MRNTILILTLALCLYQISFAQQDKIAIKHRLKGRSYSELTDSLLKKEIGLFNTSGEQTPDHIKTLKLLLTEIPLKKCTQDGAYFSKGSVIISISKDEKIGQGLARLTFIHVKYALELPDTAISDIANAEFCPKPAIKSKLHTAFRVFRSKDNHRVYIHMVNDKAQSPYEVTWVIVDSKYRFRVVDPITI